MDKFDELLKELQSIDRTQRGCWDDDLYELGVWQKYFDDEDANYKELKSNLDVNTHRWWESSITVISIFGRILGIRHISNVFSENMDYSDVGFTYGFFEMEEVSTISYQEKI